MKHHLQASHHLRLAMTFRMQQSLAILQMPQIELRELIQEEIDKNPLLEEIGNSKKQIFEKEIAAQDSLYENLLRQIRENLPERKESQIGEKILENIDEKGFLSVPLAEIGEESEIQKVLEVMQTFHPPGIFARNLQESILIQLKAQGYENTTLFTLVQNHYPDLLHGRYSVLKKIYPYLDLAEAIQKLASLPLRPLNCLKEEILAPIIPDITIRKTETGWSVGTNDEELPKFLIHSRYDSVETSSLEEQKTMQAWRSQGKWLLNALSRRKKILLEIGILLTRRQSAYLSQKGALKAFTNQELSLELGLHESTISRALSGKYAETPQGIIPLKSLLTSAPLIKEAKKLLQELIRQEDRNSPLTDEELSEKLKQKGYSIARRTISKYRGELKIQSAPKRKGINKPYVSP